MRVTILAVKLIAALSGLASAFLLFYSLSIASSPFRPVLTKDGAHLCFDGKPVAAGYGGPLGLSSESCPGWDESKPAALVSTEHPSFVTWGLCLLVLSFLFQLIDILGSAIGTAKQDK